MRSIELADERISSVLLVAGEEMPRDEADLVVRLADGRSFSLSVTTLEGLKRRLGSALACVVPTRLLVRDLSDKALGEAVRSALSQGLERFGTLQAPIEQ
jgi:hypothetical protein